jgi:hypothetical protein
MASTQYVHVTFPWFEVTEVNGHLQNSFVTNFGTEFQQQPIFIAQKLILLW